MRQQDIALVNCRIPLSAVLNTPEAISRQELRQAQACERCGRKCKTPPAPDCGGLGMTRRDWQQILRGFWIWKC